MARSNPLRRQLRQFLSNHFPGLELRAGLFYHWPHSLRFDLQPDDEPEARRYFAAVQHRATTLFAAGFAPTDEVLVVGQKGYWPRTRIRRRGALLRRLPGAELGFYRRPAVYPYADYGRRHMLRVVAYIRAAAIDYPGLLAGIAHQDFPGQAPVIWEEVYVLNLTRQLIFHMYDDRGLDLLAADPAALQPFYHRFTAWLLDYDRARMDAHFAGGAGAQELPPAG